MNSFGKDRDEDLSIHPTVKNCDMISDAIRNVTNQQDIVLDPFGGSGTTQIAAERTGRRARLIELDPHYCDCILRRANSNGLEPKLPPDGLSMPLMMERFSSGGRPMGLSRRGSLYRYAL
jgi:DNA methylase